ncbi:MAG: hypothetical protein RLZZ337_1394 [Bacteroidota bacterium]|jgi:uncharacterized protein (DUF58 family)
MAKWWDNIFLNSVFFIVCGVLIVLYVLGHFYSLYYMVATIGLALLIFFLLLDAFLLYRKNGISGSRKVAAILSNGDENPIALHIINRYEYLLFATIIDELPSQLNQGEKQFNTKLNPLTSKKINYAVWPKERGEYQFGDIVVMVCTPLRLLKRRYSIAAQTTVAVYPSFVRLNRYNLKNLKYFSRDIGEAKTRKIGHSTEFEQIKGYVKGDEMRYINWKASAKRNQLMVNQYTDEKAQQVYCILDTGRAMQMPFDGLSLLDYAINASLALSQIIIKKNDKAGLLYFNKKVDKILPADKSLSQIPKILNTLYNLKTAFFESNFEKLYAEVKFRITHRSLMLIFTNFEDMNSLKRQLPYLKGIARNNVLLVVFFKNRELEEMVSSPAKTGRDFYYQAVGEKLIYQKKLMVKELQRHGIQSLLTDPQNLTTDTISKYLEIKAKAII